MNALKARAFATHSAYAVEIQKDNRQFGVSALPTKKERNENVSIVTTMKQHSHNNQFSPNKVTHFRDF